MSFTDIRNVELGDGTSLPMGHPNFAGMSKVTGSANVQFNLELCDTAGQTATGTLMVTAVNSDGVSTEVIIPIKGASPLNTLALETTNQGNLYCSSCQVKHSSTTKAAYNFEFSGKVTAQISVFNSNVKITSYSTTSLSTTKNMVVRSNALVEGRDYGTVAQRDNLSRRKGQIFFVKIED